MPKLLATQSIAGCEPEIGRWLWALEEVRRGTLTSVKGLKQAALDWRGQDGDENAIGSLLYHIALIEMSWLFEDILLEGPPQWLSAEFPLPVASEGALSHVPLVPLDEHVRRLDRTRSVFLKAFRGMTLDDWRRVRRPADVDYAVTPEWAVFHLVEHEAGHGAQIRSLKSRAVLLGLT